MINPTRNARFLPLALALLSMVARSGTARADDDAATSIGGKGFSLRGRAALVRMGNDGGFKA